MGANIPEWTRAATGTAMSPSQFIQSPEAQNAVFRQRFGGYLQQYGNPQDAASAWFTGRPQAQGGNASDTYINGNEYVRRFNQALGVSPSNAAALAGGGLPTPKPAQIAQTSIQGGTPVPDQPQQQPQPGGVLGQPEAPMAPPQQQQQGILGQMPQMPQIPFYMRRTNPQLAYQRIPLPPGFQGFQGA